MGIKQDHKDIAPFGAAALFTSKFTKKEKKRKRKKKLDAQRQYVVIGSLALLFLF